MLSVLQTEIEKRLGAQLCSSVIAHEELTIEVSSIDLLAICQALKTEPDFHFDMLMDIAGVDYLEYGVSEWSTTESTLTGFSRARMEIGTEDGRVHPSIVHTESTDGPICPLASSPSTWHKPRLGVVYHLLSLKHNRRMRVRTFVDNEQGMVPSVMSIWQSANWYEREVFDLFGILFSDHPDLRRILTDYGFIGHPFLKDFPVIGTVEMRYSAKRERVIYEPVSIDNRNLVPKVIRPSMSHDHV